MLPALTDQAQILGDVTLQKRVCTHRRSVWAWLVGGQPAPWSPDDSPSAPPRPLQVNNLIGREMGA